MHRPTPDPAPVTTATPVVAVTVRSAGPTAGSPRRAASCALVQGRRAGRDVDRVLPERIERDDLQGPLVGGGQHHGRGDTFVVRPQPVGRGHAPAVPRHQPGESELRSRTAEVVADPALVVKELGGYHRADRVTAAVFLAGVAAAVPVEAGDRV